LDAIKVFAIDIDGTLTENGGGMLHLPAIQNFRTLEKLGYKIIYVTGRSSVEALVLAVFGGTTRVAVGENGGVVTTGPTEHIILGNKEECVKGFNILKKSLSGVRMKRVFNRLSEVVLERSFDLQTAQNIFDQNNLDLNLIDSKFSFHINSKNVNKAFGFSIALQIMNVKPSETIAIGDSETDIPLFDYCGYSIALNHSDDYVKSKADYVVKGSSGTGLVEALDHIALKFLGEIK
jgi:phosphoglycolate phosphatase (TIGR01487 family)